MIRYFLVGIVGFLSGILVFSLYALIKSSTKKYREEQSILLADLLYPIVKKNEIEHIQEILRLIGVVQKNKYFDLEEYKKEKEDQLYELQHEED